VFITSAPDNDGMKLLVSILLLFAVFSIAPASAQNQQSSNRVDGRAVTMIQLSTTSFTPGGTIPRKFTCSGADVSPELSWAAPPAGTKSIALIVDDPDAPVGTWNHWLLYNLPPSAHSLPENQPHTAELANGALHGKNDFGKIGYNGPCPPPGKPHRYFFRLYALDIKLDLKAGADRRTLDEALKGHIVAQGEVMGTFGR
jgi:Raf kinase inhibitor-like YbhB/YbcL family protein